jgi:drug/metabolite transporter (DMT)-like permease
MNIIIWMILSVLCGTGIYVLLRNISVFRADSAQTLSINYVIAGVCCLFFYDCEPITATSVSAQKMLVPAIVLGTLFILGFWMVAFSSERCGVGITTTAAKMSVVIPVLVGVVAFHQLDNLWLKMSGLLLALCSFFLIFLPKHRKKEGKNNFVYVLLVFILTGVIDAGIDIANRFFTPAQNDRYLFLTITFFVAFIIGALISLYDIQQQRKKLLLSSVVLGILLGICNFGYMITVMKNLQQLGSSIVFPILNTSIVIGTVFTGIVFYKEKLDKTQWAGIALATGAVLIMTLFQ